MVRQFLLYDDAADMVCAGEEGYGTCVLARRVGVPDTDAAAHEPSLAAQLAVRHGGTRTAQAMRQAG